MEVARLTDEEARSRFRAVRFAENGGEPFCPHCGSLGFYEIKTRHIFKCKGCFKQFSLTSGTIFDNRKLCVRDILMCIAIFVNGASGVSALRLSRDLRCNYRTAFVLAHKLREVFGVLQAPHKLSGIVEIDGKWVGGHVKKANLVADRKGKPKGERTRHPNRRSIVTMRERRRGGRTLSFVFHGEHESITTILAHVHEAAKIRTDDGGHWIQLAQHFRDFKTVNHSKVGYMVNGIHTNWVESFNGRITRGIKGVYHQISGPYLQAYANEFAWREDHRRTSNGKQFFVLLSATARHPVSARWKGYWQRRLPIGATWIVQMRGGETFEIRKEEFGANGYVGYFNGERSATGAAHYVVLRALIQKHARKRAVAKIIRLPASDLRVVSGGAESDDST